MTPEKRKEQLLRNVDVLESILDRVVNHPSHHAVDQAAKVLCCQYLMLEILDQVSEFPELKGSIMEVVSITRKMLYPNNY